MFHRDYVYKKIADEVSVNLEKLCRVNNIEVISHRNVNPKKHLNTGSLHYNDQFLLETLEIFFSFAKCSTISVPKDDFSEFSNKG